MDLTYLFRILLNRLPILIALPFLAALVTATLGFLAPKEYISEARLSTGYTVINRHSLYEEGINQFKSDLKFNNLMANIKSPMVIGALSYQLLLNDLISESPYSQIEQEKEENWLEYEYGLKRDTVIAILRNKVSGFELLSSLDDREKAIIKMSWDFGYSPLALRRSLNIYRINYTDYLSLQYRSQNPFFSAFAINTLCSEFSRYHINQEVRKSLESIKFLDTLVNQKKRVLESKTDRLREYKLQNNLLNFQIESTAKLAQVKDAEIERDQIQNNIKRINFSISSIDDRLREYGVETEYLSRLRNELTRFNKRRRGEQGNYEQLSDSISRIQNELESVFYDTPGIDRELVDQRYEFLIELQVEEDRLITVDARLELLKEQVFSFASVEATISSMQQELDIAKQEYFMVQEKLNAAINSNLGSKDDLKVVVQGQPALEHQPSGLVLKSAFTFAGIFILCAIVLVGVEILDTRIKNIYRYEQGFNLKLLGIVFQGDQIPFFNQAVPKNKKVKKKSRYLPVNHAMQKIRHDLILSGQKKILFSSLENDDGKTLVLHTLAHSLASVGKHVVIIDTNFRDEKNFEKIDFGEYIKEPISLGEISGDSGKRQKSDQGIFSDKVYKWEGKGSVKVLMNKNPDGSPSEIFANTDFSLLLDEMIRKQNVDFLFLEGAPLNDFADSPELADYSDAVIIILNARKRISLEKKQKLIDQNAMNRKIMGVILNQATTKV